MFNYFFVKFGIAYILDLILADPRWLYHPVIIIGKLISFLEKILYKAKNKIFSGAILNILTLSVTFIVSLFLARTNYVVEIFFLYTTLATKSLANEGNKVYKILKSGDIEKAKKELSYLVSRDTNTLSLDKIYSSGNTIDAFSTIVREIQYLDASSAPQNFFKNNDNGKIMGNYTLVGGVRTILPYIPNVEFENSNIVKNEDISVWNITLLIIELNKNDGKNYYCSVGNLEYDKFIKKIPTDKYKFIDGAYIMLEPLTKEEILKLLDGE